jgi:hypothetical protein
LRFAARHLLNGEEGMATALVKNGRELATVLTFVTCSLACLSMFLVHFPPDHILEWSEGLKKAQELLEKAGTYAAGGVVAAGIVWLALSSRRDAADRTAVVWEGASVTQTWIKRGALVLTVVASFSFTAADTKGPNPWDGPLVALNSANLQTLDQYKHLQWKVQLQLGAELKLQIVSAIYNQLNDQDRAAIRKEIDLANREAEIPSAYFTLDDHPHLNADELLSCVKTFGSSSLGCHPPRLIAWDPTTWTVPSGGRGSSPEGQLASLPSGLRPPPLDATRHGLAHADAGVERLSHNLKTPQWMKGIGPDVSKSFFDLGLNANYLPFLRALESAHPLMSEVLGVGIDSLKESAYSWVQGKAAELEDEFVRTNSDRLDERIRETAAALLPVARQPPHDVLDKLELGQNKRYDEIEQASECMRGDLELAIRNKTAEADRLKANLDTLGVSTSHRTLPSASELSLATLRGQADRIRSYETSAALALLRRGDTPEWSSVLGPEYRNILSRASQLRPVVVPQPVTKADPGRPFK